MSVSQVYVDSQVSLIRGAKLSLELFAAGTAEIPVGAPGSIAVVIPGLLTTDLCYASCNGSAAPANLLVGIAAVPTANTLTLTATVATSATTAAYAVYRAV